MHSFFKLPFYPLLPDDPNLSLQRGRIHEFFKYTKPHRKLLEQIELVIIDEISMVRADLIDAIDRILRVYSHNLREPFGRQTVVIGMQMFSSWNLSVRMTSGDSEPCLSYSILLFGKSIQPDRSGIHRTPKSIPAD